MFSRPPTRPLLITPSASPPPQPSPSQTDLPSPSKRQRTSSRSSSVRRSVSDAESTIDFPKEREASMARMLDIWSQLAERYSRRLDEDDVVDIRTGEIVKDNGFWKATRRFNFGEALQRDDADDSVDDDSEGIDELDAFDEERNYIEDGFAKDLQQKLLTHAGHGVTNDLDEFLEAEQRRKEEYGSDVEEDELELSLKHHQGSKSPLFISDSNGEEGSSDTNGQDVSSLHVRGSRWEEQESENDYDDDDEDDDDDELDNWDPIEGSKIIPVQDLNPSPQVDGSESDEEVVKVPASYLGPTSSKRRTPPVQIYTPPPSHSLTNSSDSDPVFPSHFSSADHALGSSYIPAAESISPPPSPSKSRPTRSQSIKSQAPALEIIEISDDESPEPPSKPTKSPSSSSSSSPSPSLFPSPVPPPIRNRRQSVVPQVVITTLPPRRAQIKRNGGATRLTTLSTTASTKQTQKPATPRPSVKPTQSAKSAKNIAISGTPSKPPQSAKVANKAAASGTLSNSTMPDQRLKKTTSSTTLAKPSSARKSVQKPRKTNVRAKTKIKAPQTIASDQLSGDDQGASGSTASDSQHQKVTPEAGDHPATPPPPASSPIEPQASKSPQAKRKGYKRKRSSSAFEMAESVKVQEDLSLSPRRAASKGRARACSGAPRRSSRRSSSRSQRFSDDDDHSSSNEDVNYNCHPPRFPSLSAIPRIQFPYTPHTPSHHSRIYPPIADTRAQEIITQAMHQLAALFWAPTHPVSTNPIYPYPTTHRIHPSVGPNFMHSTPDHPHPYHFTFDSPLSAASLPPSSPKPPSSPIKPTEWRKSLVSRSQSRGRRVSFRADEKGDEPSEDDESESEHRNNNAAGNNPMLRERSSSPPRSKRKDKGKGKEKVDVRHVFSSESEQEETSVKTRVKNARAASTSAQKPRAGRPTKDRPIASGSSDPRSPEKPSKFRKSSGDSSDRL